MIKTIIIAWGMTVGGGCNGVQSRAAMKDIRPVPITIIAPPKRHLLYRLQRPHTTHPRTQRHSAPCRLRTSLSIQPNPRQAWEQPIPRRPPPPNTIIPTPNIRLFHPLDNSKQSSHSPTPRRLPNLLQYPLSPISILLWLWRQETETQTPTRIHHPAIWRRKS